MKTKKLRTGTTIFTRGCFIENAKPKLEKPIRYRLVKDCTDDELLAEMIRRSTEEDKALITLLHPHYCPDEALTDDLFEFIQDLGIEF